MKRIFVVTLMLVVYALLLQCRKPVFPDFGGGQQTISFITGDDGSKGDFFQEGNPGDDVYKKLKYRWTTGDLIYVYASVDDDFSTTEDNKYCGVLLLNPECNGTTSGYFEGSVKIPSGMVGTSKMRFYHLGNDVDVNAGVASVDFANQNGKLTGENSVSSKIVAMVDMEYSSSGIYSGGQLKTKFAIVKLDLSFFGESVTVRAVDNVTNTVIQISDKGVLGYSGSTTMNLTYNTDDYYVVFVPDAPSSGSKAGEKGYIIESSSKIAKMSMNVNNCGFCTPGGSGGSALVTPTYKGVLPGKFTVNSDGKQVQFSKGNLYYNGSDSKWYFEEHQYDYRTYPGSYWVSNGTYSANTSPSGHWGLFGQSTDGTNCNWGMYTGGSGINGNFVDWGNNAIENGGKKAGLWRTISIVKSDEGEMYYILFSRSTTTSGTGTNSSTMASNARYVRAQVNSVNGLILFPDSFIWTTDMGKAPTNVNIQNSSFTQNTYTSTEFGYMETAGAVFLPAAGYRNREATFRRNEIVGYWLSKVEYRLKAEDFDSNHNTGIASGSNLYYGMCVRLVTDVLQDGQGIAEPFQSGVWN